MDTAASVFSTRQNFLSIRTALHGRDVLAEATKGANQSGFSRMEGCTRRALEAAGAAAGRRSMRQPPGAGDRQGILPRLLIPPVRQSRLPKFSGRRSHPPIRARPVGGLRLFLPSFRRRRSAELCGLPIPQYGNRPLSETPPKYTHARRKLYNMRRVIKIVTVTTL